MKIDNLQNILFVLTNRVYPSLKSCIKNRPLIVTGYIVVIGSLKPNIDKTLFHKILLLTSLVFIAFSIHNLVNYWSNRLECLHIEKQVLDTGFTHWSVPLAEISFTVITVLVFILTVFFMW